MMFQQLKISIICLLVASNSSTASVLSWITGGNKNPSPNMPSDVGTQLNGPTPVNPYPEETGECAHWGNVLPQYSSRDPTYSGGLPVSVGGTIVGSHPRVPVGSLVAVTNMKNGNTVQVRVVPPKTVPIAGRVMDLSPSAFSQVAMLSEGVFLCSVNLIQTPRPRQAEIDSLSSHTFDYGGVKHSGMPRPFVPTAMSNEGSFEGMGLLGRNMYENPYY